MAGLIWFIAAAVGGVATLVVLNRRSVKQTPADVAAVLRSLLNGKIDSARWDYFVSTTFTDPRLESIRGRCVDAWRKGSRFLQPGAIAPQELSAAGVKLIRELLQECERIGQPKAPN